MSRDYVPRDLPIEPGSDLDSAIDAVVRRQSADGPVPHLLLLKLIDVSNPAHMLALGTRLQLSNRDINNPGDLVPHLYAQWYGKPTPAAAPSATEDIAW